MPKNTSKTPSTKKICVGLVFIGDYRWDIHTIRFVEVVYEKDKTERREMVTPPNTIAEGAREELRSAYDRAKELPPEIEKRLKRATSTALLTSSRRPSRPP